jgi:AcrR family transcriptional regulator
MPRYVDHDAHRRHIATISAELVGTHGLDALTFRSVAAAAGSSTTVLTHYFTDKKHLMLATFEIVAERVGLRFDEAQASGGGLLGCLCALLPLTPERLLEWRLLTCFWGMAVSDAALSGAEAAHVRSAQRRIERLIREQDATSSRREIGLMARRLESLVHGIASHAVLDPEHWPATVQRNVLRHELASLGLMQR